MLPSEGRPLSQNSDLRKMYEIREPKYRRFADIIIDNNREPQQTAEAVVKAITGEK